MESEHTDNKGQSDEYLLETVIMLVNFIRQCDFEPYLKNISRAHALLPVLDPTFYIQKVTSEQAQFEKAVRILAKAKRDLEGLLL